MLGESCGPELPTPNEFWFLSRSFSSRLQIGRTQGLGIEIPAGTISHIAANPEASLFSYLMETTENVQAAAVRDFSARSERYVR